MKGDDWSVGYNLGVLYELNPATRFGLAYRSDVRHKLEGDVTFSWRVLRRMARSVRKSPCLKRFR